MNHFTDPEPESSCETRVQQWFEQLADESSYDSDLTPFDVGEHNFSLFSDKEDLPLIHNDELLTLDKDNTPMFDSDSDSNITLPDPYKSNLPCLDDPHDKLQFSIEQYLMDDHLDFPGPLTEHTEMDNILSQLQNDEHMERQLLNVTNN